MSLLLLIRGASRQVVNGPRREAVELLVLWVLLVLWMKRETGVVALALRTVNAGGSELDGSRGLIEVVDGRPASTVCLKRCWRVGCHGRPRLRVE